MGDAKLPQTTRLRCAQALMQTQLDSTTTVPALSKVLDSTEVDARIGAALVLARLTPENRKVISTLVAGLRAQDPEVRRSCTHALAETRNNVVAPALLALLKDPDREVRFSAAHGLSSLKLNEKIVPELILLLNDKDARLPASVVLEHLGAKATEAVPALLKAFEGIADDDDDDRRLIGNALRSIGKPAVPALLKIIDDESKPEDVRSQALEVIGQMNEQAGDAAKHLVPHLQAKSKRVRLETAVALAHLRAETNVVPYLLEGLKDRQSRYRAQSALYSLGGNAAAVDGLIPLANGDDEDLRRTALGLLGVVGQGSKKASQFLVGKLTSDTPQDLRRQAASSLPGCGDEAVPALIAALSQPNMSKLDVVMALRDFNERAASAAPELARVLDDKDRQLAAQAALALSRIDPKRTEAVPVLIEAARFPELRHEALSSLGSFGKAAAPAVPILIEALDDQETRRSAVHALSQLGPQASAAVPALIRLLPSREGHDAANALGNIGTEAAPAVPALIKLLDKERSIHAAAEALGKLGAPAMAAIPVLLKKLEVKEERSTACMALGQLGHLDSDKVLPPLAALAVDPDAPVRAQAVSALGNIHSSRTVPILIKALEDSDELVRRNALHGLER